MYLISFIYHFFHSHFSINLLKFINFFLSNSLLSKKANFYGLDMELEPELEPEPEPQLFKSWNQNQNHNFSKVGTGTVKNSYASTTLIFIKVLLSFLDAQRPYCCTVAMPRFLGARCCGRTRWTAGAPWWLRPSDEMRWMLSWPISTSETTKT